MKLNGVDNIISVIDDLYLQAEKLRTGNKAAGKRLRKVLLTIAKSAKEGRKQTIAYIKSLPVKSRS